MPRRYRTRADEGLNIYFSGEQNHNIIRLAVSCLPVPSSLSPRQERTQTAWLHYLHRHGEWMENAPCSNISNIACFSTFRNKNKGNANLHSSIAFIVTLTHPYHQPLTPYREYSLATVLALCLSPPLETRQGNTNSRSFITFIVTSSVTPTMPWISYTNISSIVSLHLYRHDERDGKLMEDSLHSSCRRMDW